jgi:predicted nucleotidyltransferase
VPNSPVEDLSVQHSKRWVAIMTARQNADERRRALAQLIQGHGGEIGPDSSLIVFGSLARGEWTARSDLDWTLLVDGQVNAADMRTAKTVKRLLIEDKWTEPGPSGVFGSLSFSHSLVHQIGGIHDTHANLTRRILLLLESLAIHESGIRDRVIRALLERYLEEDTHFHASKGSQSFVPRFLLNDIVRFWRTMAVDYANKTQEPDGRKWALRNVKLRLSRKLIFACGLLLCFRCHLEQQQITGEEDLFESDESNLRFINFLVHQINEAPLDVVADFLLRENADQATVCLIFDSYDRFLAMMEDSDSRERLEALTYAEARDDSLFNEFRNVGENFQDGIRRLFFDTNTQIARLSQVYAVF